MTDAYVHAVLEAGAVTTAASRIADIDAVSDVHVVTGEYDVVAVVDLDEEEDLHRVVADEIHDVPGVVDTVTNVAYEP